MVMLRLDGTRVNLYRGTPFTQATAAATATGLADIIVRTKVSLYSEEGQGLAAAVDVRLPTGRTEDLLGTGSTSVRFSGIGSIESGSLSAHANAGITFGGITGGVSEVSYGGAIAAAPTPHLTITGEALGRWLDTSSGIVPVSSPNPGIAGVNTIRLQPAGNGLNIVTVVPGVKWNLSDTWVLAASAMIPLTKAGLTTPVVPFVGVDYAFGKP
jgi:hypothetical protein